VVPFYFAVHILDGIRFLGCTLWTDFEFFGQAVVGAATAGYEMNDYKRVRLSSHQYRKLRPSDTLSFHARSKAWLQKEFEASLPCRKVVVVTHHAPSMASVRPELREDALTPAFASNLDDIVSGSGAALWIHGHIHSSASYTLGRTRVVCNPRGYSFEPNPEFDPGLILEV
jgi:hypothetical protein